MTLSTPFWNWMWRERDRVQLVQADRWKLLKYIYKLRQLFFKFRQICFKIFAKCCEREATIGSGRQKKTFESPLGLTSQCRAEFTKCFDQIFLLNATKVQYVLTFKSTTCIYKIFFGQNAWWWKTWFFYQKNDQISKLRLIPGNSISRGKNSIFCRNIFEKVLLIRRVFRSVECIRWIE